MIWSETLLDVGRNTKDGIFFHMICFLIRWMDIQHADMFNETIVFFFFLNVREEEQDVGSLLARGSLYMWPAVPVRWLSKTT